MSRDPSTTSEPIELEAPHGASALTIAWSDGARSRYRHALLRGFCPCAHCQGHQGPVRWAEGARDEDLPLVLVEEVGDSRCGSDGRTEHATGIYSFEYLRRLAPLARRADEAGLDAVRGETVAR